MCEEETIEAKSDVETTVACDPHDEVRWYAMYCHHRSESVVCKHFENHGIEYFHAKVLKIVTIGGRKQKVLRSAIPGYVFAHASYNTLKPLTEPGSKVSLSFKLNICDLKGDKFIIVPDRDMRNFITVAEAYDEHPQYISIDEPGLADKLRKGLHVRVIGGSFDGYDGQFVQLRRGQRRQLVVVLNGVTAITARVDPDYVEIVDL